MHSCNPSCPVSHDFPNFTDSALQSDLHLAVKWKEEYITYAFWLQCLFYSVYRCGKFNSHLWHHPDLASTQIPFTEVYSYCIAAGGALVLASRSECTVNNDDGCASKWDKQAEKEVGFHLKCCAGWWLIHWTVCLESLKPGIKLDNWHIIKKGE